VNVTSIGTAGGPQEHDLSFARELVEQAEVVFDGRTHGHRRADTAYPRTEQRAHRCRHSSATPTMGPVAGALTMVFGAGAACLLDPTLLEPGPGLVVGAGLTGLVVVPSRRDS